MKKTVFWVIIHNSIERNLNHTKYVCDITLSKASQGQKAKGHMISLICGTQSQYKHKQCYIYTYIHIQNVYPNVGLVERPREERKERQQILMKYITSV
jgi:hypothetical protein